MCKQKQTNKNYLKTAEDLEGVLFFKRSDKNNNSRVPREKFLEREKSFNKSEKK